MYEIAVTDSPLNISTRQKEFALRSSLRSTTLPCKAFVLQSGDADLGSQCDYTFSSHNGNACANSSLHDFYTWLCDNVIMLRIDEYTLPCLHSYSTASACYHLAEACVRRTCYIWIFLVSETVLPFSQHYTISYLPFLCSWRRILKTRWSWKPSTWSGMAYAIYSPSQ